LDLYVYEVFDPSIISTPDSGIEALHRISSGGIGHSSRGWGVLYNKFTCVYNSPWLYVGIKLSFLGPVMSSLYYDIQD